MTVYLCALTCICSFKNMPVHEQLTVSNSLLFPAITYVFNGNCAVGMHEQLQICIIATHIILTVHSYILYLAHYHHVYFHLCSYAHMHTPC